MAKELALDVETTTYNKGNPYDSRNKLVCYSAASDDGSYACRAGPYTVQTLQSMVDSTNLLVGFNFKFDYHWLNNIGVDLSRSTIWDVQLAEFILSNQTLKLSQNSLNAACEKYGIPKKLDVVATEYWARGVQTDEIPWHILEEYAAHDAAVTLACYHAQRDLMTKDQKKLLALQCMDMHILREMEGNGLPFDEQLCLTRSMEVDARIQELQEQLRAYYPRVPINFASTHHLSAFLYGGIVKEEAKEHIGYYKTGEKAGQPKYKNIIIEHQLPQLYKPLKGSEMATEGLFSTDEATLRKLRGKKKTVDLLLELSKLEKLNGTYYRGLVNLRQEMHWPEGTLHGQFNQTVAATGRLSSSKP